MKMLTMLTMLTMVLQVMTNSARGMQIFGTMEKGNLVPDVRQMMMQLTAHDDGDDGEGDGDGDYGDDDDCGAGDCGDDFPLSFLATGSSLRNIYLSSKSTSKNTFSNTPADLNYVEQLATFPFRENP